MVNTKMKCLFCHHYLDLNVSDPRDNAVQKRNYSNSETTDDEEVITKDAETIFLLQNIFDMSAETCNRLLGDYGDPSFWVYCCSSCSSLIDTARCVFNEMALLQAQFVKLQVELKNAVVNSVNSTAVNSSNERLTDIVLSHIKKFCKMRCSVTTTKEARSVNNFSNASQELTSTDTMDSSYIDKIINMEEFKNCNVGDQIDEEREMISNRGDNPFNFSIDEIAPVEQQQELPVKKIPANLQENVFHGNIPLGNGQIIAEVTAINDEIMITAEIPISIVSLEIQNKNKKEIVNPKVHKVVSENGDIRYQCNQCDRTFAQARHITAHYRTHTGDKPFECKVCGTKFTRSGDLTVHLQTHENEQLFSCGICHRKFNRSTNLHRHLKSHKNIKPHKCEYCGWSCAHLHDLKKHVLRHPENPNRPFKCQNCRQLFPKELDLIAHVKSHDGENPFHCHLCGKIFSRLLSLEVHLRKHNGSRPYKCRICSATFKAANTLNQHEITHDEDRKYECGVCGKRYTQKGKLKEHESLHTGEMMTCEICGKLYLGLTRLKVHLKTHDKR